MCIRDRKNGMRMSKMEEELRTGDVLKIGKKRFVRVEMV